MGAQLTRFGHVVPGPLSLDRILNAQGSLPNNACGVVPAAGQSEPIHPVCDGDFIISPLDLTATFPSQSKTASYYDDGVDGTFALTQDARLDVDVHAQLGVERRYRCTDSGSICHQDDIEIAFGTAPSPTSAQSALIAEIHALLPVPQHGQRDFRLVRDVGRDGRADSQPLDI
ncbi:uncharacterized protein B0H18DRAFT_1116115 [Fomitopsis serialis]|uniref:uncharacterized protein n=1 Tax=Fomitopsis serialis TaxID=139415 RepID=UPI002007C82B|nr:uncharacterized protein B0H18DRAFT_1116115 [Neoantrodia serialis]KAH9931862.1 hypothetical protein B0H18DRAFT_1116115 [Neoantrodia serialis]